MPKNPAQIVHFNFFQAPKSIKYLLSLSMLVCVILAGAPGIIGIEAEKQYRLLTEQFEQNTVRMLDHRYHRGWFSSVAETEILFTVPATTTDSNSVEQSEIRLSLQSSIAHGLLTSTGRIGLADIKTRVRFAGKNRSSRDNTATLQTLIELNGAGRTLIDIPSMELSVDGRRTEISIGGLNGVISYAAGMSSARINAGMTGLTLGRGPDNQLKLGQLSIDAEKWQGTAGLSLAKGKLSLNGLEVYGKSGARSLKLDQMGFEFEGSETADHAALKVHYLLGTVEFDGAVYGPGRIVLVVDNLPVPALIKIQEAMEILNRQRLPQEQQRMAMMNILMVHGLGLLKDDPWLVIDALQLETPEGRITGELRLQTKGVNWIDVIRGLWVEKMVGDASLRMPEPIFKQILQQLGEQRISRQMAKPQGLRGEREKPDSKDPALLAETIGKQQFETLLNQGLLKRDAGDVTVDATLSKGMLVLNGRNVPVSLGTGTK